MSTHAPAEHASSDDVSSSQSFDTVVELKEAAERTREAIPWNAYGRQSVVKDALYQFTLIDEERVDLDDVAQILRTTLMKIIENPHNPYIDKRLAIAAAKWYGEQTADEHILNTACKAEAFYRLGFPDIPSIVAYAE